MSAFQDFGPLSERRRAEKQQRRRKTFMVAGASISVAVILLVVGVVAVVHQTNDSSSTSKTTSTSSSSSSSTPQLHTSSKSVQMICSVTNHKDACVSSLNKANLTSNASPKELVRAAVSILFDSVGKAFSHSALIKSDDPKVQGAIQYCHQLFNYSKEELITTLNIIDAHDLEDLPKKTHELNSWLSAVVTYQENCVDEFPEGELKDKMREAMKTSQDLTCNALSIVKKASQFLSLLDIPGLSRRRLLAAQHEAEEASGFDEEGIPSWVSDSGRRILKGQGRMASKLPPNVTVAQDGSGDFKTIQAALDAIPADFRKKNPGRYVIYVKTGTYNEHVIVDKNMENITMYGDGSQKTIVTGSANFIDGTQTFKTATFSVLGNGFMGIAMGFRNTAGPEKHQAVALRVVSECAIFLNCRMEAYQDTLYAQSHRQYYRSCVISGTVDFIFGDASAVFQNCLIVVRRPLDNQQNIITAQGRVQLETDTGFVIHNSRIVAEPALLTGAPFRNYLARPWKPFSTTIYMESEIPAFIHPDGYMPWEGDLGLDTLTYAEFQNRGAGSDTSKRVKWAGVKVLSREQANRYTPANYIDVMSFIPSTGKGVSVPVHLGFFH